METRETQAVEVLDNGVRDNAAELPDQARCITVASQEEYSFAEEWVRDVIIPLRDQIRSTFRPHIQRAHEMHHSLIAEEKRFLDPVEQADTIIRGSMRNYALRVEQERKEAGIRERQERERAELAARLEGWGATTFTAIAYAATCIVEDEQRKAAAAAAEKLGDTEAAESIRSEIGQHDDLPSPAPVLFVVPPTVRMPEEPKGMRSNWKARVVDFPALVRYVAAHPEHIGLVKPDQSALDKLAKALREGVRTVGGIEAYNDATVAVRR